MSYHFGKILARRYEQKAVWEPLSQDFGNLRHSRGMLAVPFTIFPPMIYRRGDFPGPEYLLNKEPVRNYPTALLGGAFNCVPDLIGPFVVCPSF
jgi:hypothetical protein